MADADSTTRTISINTSKWINACDALSTAKAIAEFVQGMALHAPRGEGVHLQPGELTGLFYVMNGLIDQITLAEVALEREPEAAPA